MAGATFQVTVEWERESGKFAPRDEIVDEIRQRLEDAANEEICGVGADGDSIYYVIDMSVTEVES